MFLNVGGLTASKISNIEKVIFQEDLDIICFAETWKDYLPRGISGYSIARIKPSLPVEGTSRGKQGMILLVRDGTQCQIEENVTEFGLCALVNSIVYIFVYIPPDILCKTYPIKPEFLAQNVSQDLMIFGDFNIREHSPEEDSLTENFSDFGIRKMELKSHTFSRGSSKTSPDKLFSNMEISYNIRMSSFSEHNMILASYYPSTAPKRVVRFDTFKIEKFKEKIQSRIVKCLENDTIRCSIDSEYLRIENITVNAFSCIRSVSKRHTFKLPEEILELKRRKNRIRRDPERDLTELDQLRRQIKTMIRGLKRAGMLDYYRVKDIRVHCNSLIARRTGTSSAPNSTKEDLNRLLESFIVPGEKYRHMDFMEMPEDYIDTVPISIEEVKESIVSLKNNKAAGFSGIKSEMVKMLPGPMLRRLLGLFNRILDEHRIPITWKRIRIHPVPKGKDDFRPISVVEIFRKVFEKILLSRIEREVELSVQQGGFRRGLSTIDQALILDDHLRRANGNMVAVTLDIRKAYDSVDRRLLYGKLGKCSLSNKYKRTLIDLLENNNLRITQNGIKSDIFPLLRGLPQGSLLSPLLFNLFINDIVDSFEGNDKQRILLYADDILLFGYSNSNVQRLVDKCVKHADSNNYAFNPKKCNYISSEDVKIKVAGEEVEKVKVLKYLGYHFNLKGLDLNKNISSARRACLYRTTLVRKTIKRVYKKDYNPNMAILLFKIYIRPIIDYFNIAIGNTKMGSMKLEILQRKCLKYLFGWCRRMSTETLYGVLPLETVEQRKIILNRSFLFRIKDLQGSNILKATSNGRTKIFKSIIATYDCYKEESNKFLKNEFLKDNRLEMPVLCNIGYKDPVKNFKAWYITMSRLNELMSLEDISPECKERSKSELLAYLVTLYI